MSCGQRVDGAILQFNHGLPTAPAVSFAFLVGQHGSLSLTSFWSPFPEFSAWVEPFLQAKGKLLGGDPTPKTPPNASSKIIEH